VSERRAADPAEPASEPTAVGDALDAALGPAIIVDSRLRTRSISPGARRLLPAGARPGMPLVRALDADAHAQAVVDAVLLGRPLELTVAGRSVRLHPTALGAATRRTGWLIGVEALPPAAARGAVCFHGMWTQDAAMKEVFRVVERVALDDTTVLVRGETGTGKELVAQALHAISPRRQGPFRAINCAALPANLLESELFGHARGAFTGAIRDSIGHLQAAHGGTLFLDEVAEMPLELQAKLLRVLETRTVLPVGARDAVPVDVRIVSATHRALRKEADAGRFRRDLLYRLRVIPIFLPPLRDRIGDIPLLCERLVAELTPRSRRQVERVSPAAIDVLERHDWPGNVRELRNSLAYAYAIGDGPVILPSDLPPELLGTAPREVSAPVTEDPEPARPAPARAPDSGPARRILDALQRAGGNRERAAQALGMSRVTLWRQMRALGLVSKP
jgi:transcriptional regulator with PAS, ATPase and Fis domain